jgi:hypothetical protein
MQDTKREKFSVHFVGVKENGDVAWTKNSGFIFKSLEQANTTASNAVYLYENNPMA